MWILISTFLLIWHYDRCVLANRIIYKDNQLYEGSLCRLPTGREGVCVNALDCPARMEQILHGDYSAAGRCGFKDFEEIFCCTEKVTRSKDREIRPAEVACKRHKEIVWNIDNGAVQPSLVNGELAKVGEFPHMAVIGYSVPEEGAAGGIKYTCGGTLISEKHVLTAAHCVQNIHGLIPREVVLGTIDLAETVKSANAQRIPISKVIQHPEYKRGSSYHNLAILELAHPVIFTIDVYPTCLMTRPLIKANLYDYNSLVVLGWGEVHLNGSTSMKLVKAESLKFVDNKRCFKRYANVANNIPDGLDDAMICVRDPNVNRKMDTCWRDGSGGPLLSAPRKFPTLVGVASFGQACGGNSPAAYVSVYKYLDWIEDHVWQ